MQLVATASKEVNKKNLILIVLCLVFTVWFGYDGLVGYPAHNDEAVQQIKEKNADAVKEEPPTVQAIFEKWPGWKNADDASKKEVEDFVSKRHPPYKWHSRLDILVQLIITGGLAVVTAGAIWYYFRCTKRRATANDAMLSPSPGVEIPWEKITVVDNMRWKKSGIVRLTYTDETGTARQAVLDDYHLDNLRPILQELATRATHAEFVPSTVAPAGTEEPSADAPKG